MSNQKISKCLSFFIVLIFFIAGIYQTYDLADSYFACQNEHNGSIYEESFVDHTQVAFIEETNPLSQPIYNRKVSDRYICDITHFFCNIYNVADISALFTLAGFANIIQESCFNHFCNTVITNYIHQIDGAKIA